jgi:hypothetical protein
MNDAPINHWIVRYIGQMRHVLYLLLNFCQSTHLEKKNKSTSQQVNKSTSQQVNKSTSQQVNKSTSQQVNKDKQTHTQREKERAVKHRAKTFIVHHHDRHHLHSVLFQHLWAQNQLFRPSPWITGLTNHWQCLIRIECRCTCCPRKILWPTWSAMP